MRYESDSNYYNDRRVRASERWYTSFDERLMLAQVLLFDDDGNDEEHDIPVRFKVCGTCNGKGMHVNPSVDCNGLTADDFDEDPDFREEYCAGRYDVTCYECEGRRVNPVIDEERVDPDILKAIHSQWQSQAESRAERDAERRMGA